MNQTTFDLHSFIESLYNSFPKEVRTEKTQQYLWDMTLNGIITIMMDYMSREDLEHLMTRPEVTDETISKILGNYIEYHPELQENLREELTNIEKNVKKLIPAN